MRIIAGKLKGQSITAPVNKMTHPMGDKVRGSLFNTLGDINDLEFLDGYAGSGAISIEAISRGARHSTAIEIDKKAFRSLIDNINNLNLTDEITAIKANIVTWSNQNPGWLFDIVVLDPPYDRVAINEIIKLSRHLKNNGVLVLSLPAGLNFKIPGLALVKSKEYGDAVLKYYRNTK